MLLNILIKINNACCILWFLFGGVEGCFLGWEGGGAATRLKIAKKKKKKKV